MASVVSAALPARRRHSLDVDMAEQPMPSDRATILIDALKIIRVICGSYYRIYVDSLR